MAAVSMKFLFLLAFLGLCVATETDNTVSGKEMEALRVLGPAAGTNEYTGGTNGSPAEKRGEAVEKLAAIVRAMSEQYSGREVAGEDGSSTQSRRQYNDPCSDYITLSEASRNVQDVNNGNADRCDSGFAGEWYRFTGAAGTVMPTEAPPDVYRCGTDAPMWMNGQHPSLADGEVSRQACAYWGGNTCNWQTTIQVRACSAGYFVYKLPAAPACSLAYCGVSEGPCSDYITLNEASRNVQDVNNGNADRCDSGFAGEWYRFTGSAGTVMPTAAPPSVYRCGTDAPMWMNGQHPSLADGEVSRQVCAYWGSNTCNWQTTIQVRACSAGYFVYKLPAAPACSLAYCGDLAEDVDDCAPNPCVNGDCVDGRTSYTCNCHPGYEGSNCETNIDDCAANPCVNGDCADGVNTYTCTCHSGYEGDTCDRDVDGCSPDPCDPLATCQDVAAPGTGATCSCPVGYEGDGELGGSGCRVAVPPQELSGSTSCTNDYMELAIPEHELTDVDQNNLHWEPDQNCGATTNGTHYLFRTELYGCGTKVKFDARYVTFLNTISILGKDRDAGVISRGSDVRITSKCEYKRQQWVDSTFLPIPGGLNFTEEGFGQLQVSLSMFPTRQYQSKYRSDQFPIRRKLRENVYMQLEVQGHGQELSVLALNCKSTMSPDPNDTLHYQLINDGCASDPTLDIYSPKDANKERFGFEAFRFIKEVKMVYVHCEVMVCEAGNARSRCAEGCVARRRRASDDKVDMIGRHMLYLGPIVLDDDDAAADNLRQRRSAPWAMLAAGGGLMALALVVLGAAIVQKRSRREEWAYQGLTDVEGEEASVEGEEE